MNGVSALKRDPREFSLPPGEGGHSKKTPVTLRTRKQARTRHHVCRSLEFELPASKCERNGMCAIEGLSLQPFH